MTFFHFCNCLVLAYAPYFIVFRYSSISEYSNIWKCGQAAIVYLMTQFIKMEIMKNAVDIVDVIGLYITITHFLGGKGEVRMMTAGLGWAAAHSVLTYFVVLFVGARTTGFSWRYIQTAMDSNFDLIFYLSMASLVWTFNRAELAVHSKHLSCILLIFCVFHSTIYQTIFNNFVLSSWQMIAIQSLFTIGLAFLTLVAYSGTTNEN